MPVQLLQAGGLVVSVMAAAACLHAQSGPATGRMPGLPPHPRLILTDAEAAAIKERVTKAPFLKAPYDSLMRSARAALVRRTELPDRGAQWFHWYACKADGGRLTTISPTQHKCEVCGAVYSGWPYDDVVLSSVHNAYSTDVRSLGLAYRLTRDDRYAAKAREVLLAYADKYAGYPLHNIHGKEAIGGGRVGAQTLDESTWLIPVCQGADLVWDTLSADDRERIERGLLRPAAQVIRQHKMGIHNIQCWKNSAVGLVGLLLGDAELVADAVDSPHGFRRQIAEGINDDGQWFEGAWGYHFYTMNALAPLAEAGERCGLGLYGFVANGRSLRRLFDAPLDLAMPNLVLPPFSDSAAVDLLAQRGLYELGLARCGEPRFADVLGRAKRDTLQALLVGVPALPDPPPRRQESRNFTAAGYAVLRQGEGTGATWLCLKYGPHGGGHGHPDKLSFVLYARGSLLGNDPGTGKYGVPLHGGWQKTTIAHNTLTVDQANQKATTGRCLAFRADGQRAGVLAEAGAIYPGVTYRRAAAVFGQDLIVVLDMVAAQAERTFDLAYHNTGSWSRPPTGRALTMPDVPGYRYLQGMVCLESPAAIPTVAAQGVTVSLGVVCEPAGELWTGTGPGATTTQRVPCAIVRIKGRQARVAWAVHLGEQRPEVRLAEAGGRIAAEARAGDKAFRLVVDPDGPEKLKLE